MVIASIGKEAAAMEVDEVLTGKREEILRLAARHGARNVQVFGSRARDEARVDSDVDILIQLDPGRSLLDLIAIKQDLEDLRGCVVDVVTESAIDPYLRDQALKEAVRL
jgi:predicted nucleotidyltransferase